MQSLLSNTCDLFTRIFEVFNEIETSKNRSIDYSKHEYMPHKKSKKSIPILIKICFSEGKLTKQFGPPLLSERSPLKYSSKLAPWAPIPNVVFLAYYYLKIIFSTLVSVKNDRESSLELK